MRWSFVEPVRIHFEVDGVKRLPELLRAEGFSRGLIVCDPYFMPRAQSIMSSSDGLIVSLFSQVTPNPRVTEVDACAAMLRACRADFAVALGGGSAIDLAKAACAIAHTDRPAADFHTCGVAVPDGGLPLVAIPTTAGTGSEVTCVSVLTDDEKGVKAPMSAPGLFPRLALVDAELTVSMPPKVTASCGLDALSHALEGFWSTGHQPVCDACALHAARLVFTYLTRACLDGDDREARTALCEASVVAGIAFGLPKTAASHACSFPLTTRYGLPHGEACAFTLDTLCHINAQAEHERLNIFAQQLGFPDAGAMGDRISEIKQITGMRHTLSQAGISEADLPALVQACHHPNLLNNPVPLTDDMLMTLFLSKI